MEACLNQYDFAGALLQLKAIANMSPLQKVLSKVRRVISSGNQLKNIAFAEY